MTLFLRASKATKGQSIARLDLAAKCWSRMILLSVSQHYTFSTFAMDSRFGGIAQFFHRYFTYFRRYSPLLRLFYPFRGKPKNGPNNFGFIPRVFLEA